MSIPAAYPAAPATPDVGAIAPGTLLLEYRIRRVLGTGGFGITYEAQDPHLDKSVAIKEYLPSELAVRSGNNSVSMRSEQTRDAFTWGREQFLKEARVLARFNHPSLIHVYRFFEANNTAYFVMEYAEGATMDSILMRDGTLTEAKIKGMLLPILDGLKDVHRARVLHRDIKPSNIISRKDGSAVLIDFGSARQNVVSMTRSIMSVVTTGYAPIEQYAVDGHQGPWTDIYALGAVAYRAVTGRRPIEAVSRMHSDTLTPASEAAAGRYSAHFLRAVDWALAVHPEDRPVGIADWRLALEGTLAPPRREARSGPRPDMMVPMSGASEDTDTTHMLPDRADRPGHPGGARRRNGAQREQPPVPTSAGGAGGHTQLLPMPLAADSDVATSAHAGPAPALARVSGSPLVPEMAENAPPAGPEPGWETQADGDTAIVLGRSTDRRTKIVGASALLGLLGLIVALVQWLGGDGGSPPAGLNSPAPRVAVPRPPTKGETPVARPPAAPAALQPGVAISSMAFLTAFRDCAACPAMVVIPPGTFVMGSPPGPGSEAPERPAHRVTLPDAFAIGQSEVVHAEWQACVEAGACPVLRAASDNGDPGLPVVNVSYADAQAYLRWLTQLTHRRYRLPAEAEWEYAARGGTTSAHFWSRQTSSQCRYANGADPTGLHLLGQGSIHVECRDEFAGRAPAGRFLANDFGLHDTAGNVSEWQQDCWRDSYAGASGDGSPAPAPGCDRHVVRGGSWRSAPAALRAAARAPRGDEERSDDLGFRVAAD